MSTICFNTDRMFTEAQKNYRSEFSGRYTRKDVAAVWESIFKYVLNRLNNYTGVDIPNLGKFTFADVSVLQEKEIHVKPYFLVSPYLKHMYRVVTDPIPKFVKKDCHILKLNTGVIADSLNMHPHSAEVCVKEVLMALSRLLKEGKNVDFPMSGVGTLKFRKGVGTFQFRCGTVYGSFRKDFVRNLFLHQKQGKKCPCCHYNC